MMRAGQAVDHRGGFAIERPVVCVQGDAQTAEVGDILAQCEFAVDVPGTDGDAGVELTDQLGGTDIEPGPVLGGPPVGQIACGVVFASLVIKPVRHLVADDGSDRAVVQRIVGQGIEERRLENTGWKSDVVGRRVVTGVDGG